MMTLNELLSGVSNYIPSSAEYDVAELQADKFPAILKAVDLSEGWYSSGKIPLRDLLRYQKAGDHCKYCAAKGGCKAYKEKYVGNALELFKKVVRTLAERGEKVAMDAEIIGELKDKGVLDDKELAYLALNKGEIIKFLKAVPQYLVGTLKNGKANSYAKLIATNGTRTWLDNKELVIEELKKLGISKPLVVTEKIIGIGEVEKTIGKGKIGKLVKSPSNPYKLVAIDDKRPAVKFGLDTAALFKDAVASKGNIYE